MDRPDERDRRIRELEERLSRLSEASLRITEDLDFNTVLQGVLDSARSLACARYGAITLVDAYPGLQDVFFSGITEQEARQVPDLPGGEQLLRYFSELPGALRVADLNGHLRSLGLLRGECQLWRSKEPLTGRSQRLCARPSVVFLPIA